MNKKSIKVPQFLTNALARAKAIKVPPIKMPSFTLTKRSHKKALPLNAQRVSTLFAPRFSSKDQVFFAKRLSFLVNSNVPILESLHILKEQTTRRGAISVYQVLIQDISSGKSLFTSLKRFPRAFGDFALNIVRVGEMSGSLSKNLLYLADELQKRYVLKKKIQGAMVYPIFITIGTLGLTILLTAFIFPKIMPIFTSLHVTLPLSTRILIAISDYFRLYGIVTIGGLIAASLLFMFLLKRFEHLRFAVHGGILRIPVIGGIIKTYNMANFSRTLGILLKSSLTVTDGVSITADTTNNLIYRAEYHALSKKILAGEQLSKYMNTRKRFFPPLMVHMIAIGERTGNLPDTLLYLAELYENDIDELTKNLSGILEPALMVVMGVIVGFVAVSVITPIYEITQSLSH